MKTIAAEGSFWMELTGRKEEFRNIVRLLLDFDEKTGRYARYGDPETHYMRKAVAQSSDEKARVFLKELGGFVYHVVVEVRSSGGLVSTGWIHEDGIRSERESYCEDLSHPVHGIVCLSDLYQSSCRKISLDSGETCLDTATLDLLTDDAYDR